ncbi:zf-HC2 domain-containing protein [Thermoflavimicrobium daqui]|uniref:Zf-HC2 domain-containing protein n=1 Tax=Thermoflavimicrobium daqui TaxID=2137476 RepID=A0A364K6F0_9BACL|nr:zf-HC2 domain-containing protein [Thermoflavimicrobium daqui]RAL25873.1 hypothetical protein DL897_07290 [Thermoflavimicrobium daqui]
MNTLCQDIVLKLPWVVNGRLETKQKTFVYRHLATCQSCQKELLFYLQLKRNMTQLSNQPSKHFKQELFTDLQNTLVAISPQLSTPTYSYTMTEQILISPLGIAPFLISYIKDLYQKSFNQTTTQLKMALQSK